MQPALRNVIAALLGLCLIVGGLWPAGGSCGSSNPALQHRDTASTQKASCCKPGIPATACCQRACCTPDQRQGSLPDPTPAPSARDEASSGTPPAPLLYVLPELAGASNCRPASVPSRSSVPTVPRFLRDRTLLI